MSAERELAELKAALRAWANSKTYAEGCHRWARVVKLLGEDPAHPLPTGERDE